MINLVQAIERGDISLFKQLIANGFDLNAWCDTQMLTLLHHAVFYEQKELVEYFLQQGINVNAIDEDGQTALLHLLANNELSLNSTFPHYNFSEETLFALVKTLLDYNATQEPDFSGMHPLHSVGTFASIGQLLLERGGDPNAQTKNGFTPLMNCAYYGNLTLVISLLKHGAVINSRDNLMRTALHHAIGEIYWSDDRKTRSGNIDVIKALVDHGALHTLRDIDERTPLDLALHIGNPTIIAYLSAYSNF